LRENIHNQLRLFLEKADNSLLKKGKKSQALELFEAGLVCEPLYEAYYQGMMAAYDAEQRPAEAMLVYRRCSQLITYTYLAHALACLQPGKHSNCEPKFNRFIKPTFILADDRNIEINYISID